MEYIENGHFLQPFGDGRYPWRVTLPVQIIQDPGPDGNHALFGPGGRLGQDFSVSVPPEPKALLFSMDIQVSGGDGKPNGDVQLLFEFQRKADTPQTFTFDVAEFGVWTKVYLSLDLPADVTHVDLLLIVLRRFEKPVSVRKVSVVGTDAVKKGGNLPKAKKTPSNFD